jgi:CrcB protein
MHPLVQCLTVGVAGFFGAVARFGLNHAAAAMLPGQAWVGTLVINLTGSFALGWFLSAVAPRLEPSHPLRLAVAVGFLGAYTTFSTFTAEADGMIRRGEWTLLTAYVGGSVLLGIAACAAGVAAGR